VRIPGHRRTVAIFRGAVLRPGSVRRDSWAKGVPAGLKKEGELAGRGCGRAGEGRGGFMGGNYPGSQP